MDKPAARRIQPAEQRRPMAQLEQGLVVVVGRWTGGLAGALRTALRDGIDDYAVRLGVGVSTAGDWEDKPAVVPQPVNQQALDEVLRRADDDSKRRFVALTLGNELVLVSDSLGLTPNGVITRRRDLTKTAAAGGLASALAPLDALERIAAQRDYPVDSGLVAAHEKFADALAELSPTRRPDELVAPVAERADELLALLDRPMTEANRRRVEEAAVSSCAHAGMLAFNMGERRLARGCFALARSVAEDSGDDALRARALGVGAILLSPMPGGGRYGDPRRQAERLSEALSYARAADPDTRASLQWWLATALAGKRDERGFRQAIEAADRLAGRIGCSGGTGFLARHFAYEGGGPVGDKNTGIGLLLLGRPDAAVEAFMQALAAVDPSWGAWRVTVLADIAAARVLQDEPEAACAGLREALDLADQSGYGMGMQRIVGVRLGFPEPWADLACVRELDERLHAGA